MPAGSSRHPASRQDMRGTSRRERSRRETAGKMKACRQVRIEQVNGLSENNEGAAQKIPGCLISHPTSRPKKNPPPRMRQGHKAVQDNLHISCICGCVPTPQVRCGQSKYPQKDRTYGTPRKVKLFFCLRATGIEPRGRALPQDPV